MAVSTAFLGFVSASVFLHLVGIILLTVGGLAITDTIFYAGSQGDLVANGIIGPDTHLISPIKFCDDYAADQGPNACSTINQQCVYTSTFFIPQNGINNAQQFTTTVTLPDCAEFNTYRVAYILTFCFSFFALIVHFINCFSVNLCGKISALSLGIVGTICGIVMVGTMIDWQQNQFNPYLHTQIFFASNAFPNPPNVNSSLGNGALLQIFGFVLVAVATAVGGALFCECVVGLKETPREIALTNTYANYYTQNSYTSNPASMSRGSAVYA